MSAIALLATVNAQAVLVASAALILLGVFVYATELERHGSNIRDEKDH